MGGSEAVAEAPATDEQYWSSTPSPASAGDSYWSAEPPKQAEPAKPAPQPEAPAAPAAMPAAAPAPQPAPAKPQPTATIGPHTPTVTESLRNAVANSAVGHSLESALPKVADALNLHPSETVNSPTYQQHQDQLIAPEYLIEHPGGAGTPASPTENRVRGVAEALGNLTSGRSMATMAGTAAAAAATAGVVNPASAQLLSRLVAGGFTLDMLHGLYQQSKAYRQAVDSGNVATAQQIQGQMGVNGVMSLLTAAHAAGATFEPTRGQYGEKGVRASVPGASADASYRPAYRAPNPETGAYDETSTVVPGKVNAGVRIGGRRFGTSDVKPSSPEYWSAQPPKPEPKALSAGRPVVQASDNPEAIRASAAQQEPTLNATVQGALANVDGAEVVGSRVKDGESQQNKADREKPVETQKDHLGVRISAETPAAAKQAEQALAKDHKVVGAEPLDNNGLEGRQVFVQTGKPGDANQVSEVQILPAEQVKALEETDPLYDQQKKALAAGDKEKAGKLADQITEIHQDALHPKEEGGRGESPEPAGEAAKPAASTAESTTMKTGDRPSPRPADFVPERDLHKLQYVPPEDAPAEVQQWDKDQAAKWTGGKPSLQVVSETTEQLDPAKLKTTQPWASDTKLKRWETQGMGTAGMPAVEVLRTPDGDYIVDGVHRATVAQRAGETVTAKVYTVKAPAETKPAETKPAEGETKYEFGSTQHDIAPDSEAGKALKEMQDKIAPEDLAGKGKDIDSAHVTLRYGIQGDDTSGIRKYLEQQAPFEVRLGRVTSFPPTKNSDGAAVLIAPVGGSPELRRMNAEVEQHGDFKPSDFPDYKPHATIAYVRPEAVEKYTGDPTTLGKTFRVDSISISDRNGNKELVKLGGAEKPSNEVAKQETTAPARITKGANVTLPDGTSGSVAWTMGGKARVRVDDGSRRDVPLKDLKPREVEGVTSGTPGQPQPKPGAIAVDLDKTLAHYDGFKGATVIGKPIESEVARVKKLLAEGEDVWLYTARAAHEEAIPALKAWTKEHIGQELPITNIKYPEFARFIDDRAELPEHMQKGEEAKPAEPKNELDQKRKAFVDSRKPKEPEAPALTLTAPPEDIAIQRKVKDYIESLPGKWQKYARDFYDELVKLGGGKDEDGYDRTPEVEPRDYGIPETDMRNIEDVDSELRMLADTAAKAHDIEHGDRTTSPASLDQAGGRRPAADLRGEDRPGVEPAPQEVLSAAEGKRDTREADQADRADVRRDAAPVPEPRAESGPGEGSGAGDYRTPAGPLIEKATRALDKQKTLNKNWYAHPEGWKPPTGTVGRLEANLKAIRILRDIEKTPRKLSDDEKHALANYVGWGALQHTFAPWSAPRDEYGKWKAANEELQRLLSPDELARAQESTKNAHYTSPELVRFMWDTMQRLGFKAGNILEPSVGTGNFLGMMPKAIRSKSRAIANEMDSVSHAIAQLLYPEATHFSKDFADLILPNNDVDLAIGNPPFGGYKLYDPNYKNLNALVHDFFFVKSLDKVRPGGILAFITSTGTLDKQDPSIRNILASKADFLGAIRLPSGAFKANAGTDVTTDLIFLQKRAPGQEAKHADAWLNSTETPVPGKNGMEKLSVNEYFQKHPEMMLGRPTASSKMYGGVGFVLEAGDGNITDLLKDAQKQLPRGIYKDEIQQATGSNMASTIAEFAPDNLKQGQFTVDSKGKLKQNIDGKLVDPEAVLDKAGKIQPAKAERFKALVGVRDAMNQLLSSMMTQPDTEDGNQAVADSRGQLRQEYDGFVKKYGYLNGVANNAFRDDPHYPRLLALENWDKAARVGTPADIFRKRTIFPREELRSLPDDPKAALQLVLAERGFPDVGMMARLSGKPQAEIVDRLKKDGLIYRNPSTGSYETRETYLSGYVRDKLRDATRAVEQGMKEYAPNVPALEKVVPPDIEIGDDPKTSVAVRLGSTWIPTQAIEDFIRDTFKTPGTVKYTLGTWKVGDVRRTAEVTGQYGTPRVSADELLSESLNQRQAAVYDYVDDKRVLNRDQTTLAQAAQQKIQEEFQKWAGQSTWKPELQRLYNYAYNNLAQVEYDGSHLTFPGMNPAIKLNAHQVNAVWRVLQDGRALLAHEVGAGKTFEMAAAIMEGKRVGTFKKPMLTVPNHIVEQFRQEFLHLYPAANLLVPTEKDFDSKNRQRIMARIATGDYDAVILPHSQFNLMDISPERQRVTIQKQKAELRETIESLKSDNGEKRTIKQLETAMAKLDATLKKLSDLKADKAIYFDDTGIDQLFVDEAHLYKNLSFYTKMTRVAGLQQAKAKSALRLKMKTEYLQDRNTGRGVVFATGTPIQNTMAELYTMMKYVAPDVLEKAGIRFFDDWAANFGSVITAMELAADGRSYKARSKFAQFQNVPELMNMFRSFADIKTAEDLNLPTPELETGKPIVVAVPASERLEEYVKSLMERAERVKGGQVDPSVDNMLAITTDGRKAATDMRLVEDAGRDDPDSKINTAVDKMYDEWLEGRNDPIGPTTQMAFLDLYRKLEDDQETLNLYRDMRDKLAGRGVPKEQIAIIGEHDTRIKRQQLFAKMNTGEVRILFGSTQKMGAGTNAQRMLKALHHIDLTWRPGDLAQRNGRIMRQGNLNKTVRQYNYLTERSFDAYMAQTLQGKAEFISQIMSGRSKQRVMSDVASEMVLSLEEMKIAASGNPDVKLQYDLQMQKAQLQSLERSFESQRRTNLQNASYEADRARRYDTQVRTLTAALKTIKDIEGDGEEKNLSVELDGKTFTDRKELTKHLEAMEVPNGNFYLRWNGLGVSVEVLPEQKGMNWSGVRYQPEYADQSYNSPSREMISLARSLEARLRNLPDDLEAAKVQLPRAREKAEKLAELAERKDFPEKARLDEINKQLVEVEKRLGMRDDVENAKAQAVTAEVADDAEDEAAEEPENDDEETDIAEGEESTKKPSDLGSTFYSGFADPELFKRLFPSIAERVGDWIADRETPADQQRAMMRETRGTMDRRVAVVMHKLSDARKEWTRRPREESMRFWNAVEDGRVDSLPAQDQALANLFKGAFDQMRGELQELKPEVLQNYIENYFPHLWERPAAATKMLKGLMTGKKPFAGRASFLKQRTIPTMRDGIDLGLTPKTWNPVESFLLKYAEMAQFLMGHQTLQAMKDAGTAKYVRIGKEIPEGYTQIDDRIGTVYGQESNAKGDQFTIIRGHYYAPADAARVFNNFVSRGLAGRSGVYDTINWMNQNLNALQLGISAFHAATTSINAATSDVALAIQQLAEGKPLKAGASLIKGAAVAPSILSTVVNGSRLMQEYLSPGSYAKFAEEATALADAGGRIRQNTIDLKPMDRTINAWRNGAVVEGLTHLPAALMEYAIRPVMEYYVPRMKAGAFYAMAHDILDNAQRNGWTQEKTRAKMQEAWDSVDNRFGQMVYDNLFWNKAMRDALQLSVRSVGWNFGDVRELGGGVKDAAQAAGKAAQGEVPEVTPRMAFTLALPMVSALIGGVLTYVWTRHKPETWKDYFYPRTADGTRHSIPGYMKDVFAFGHAPVQTTLNKMAPIWSLTAEAINNRDFYGTEIRHKDDPFVKQLSEFASWAGRQAVPFSFSSGAKLLQDRGAEPKLASMLHAAAKHPGDVVLGQLGFQSAPAYIQSSPALNAARDYERENNPPGTHTKQQSDHTAAFRAVVKMYRTGQVDHDQVERYRKEGMLPGNSVARAAMESRYSPLVVSSRQLSLEQILNVYDIADEQEQKQLRPLIGRKAHEVNGITDTDKRQEVAAALDRALNHKASTEGVTHATQDRKVARPTG